MRVGIFGGSFNPPHIGHLILAQSALDALSLEKVLFIPAFQSPFKPEYAGISAEDRMEMLALAIHDHPKFEMSPVEIERQGVSFTIDTLVALQATLPGAMFTLLMGADAFSDFPLWKNPEDVVMHARLGVAHRPGHGVDLAAHPFGRHTDLFAMPAIGISSSSIRECLARGASVRYQVPWTVNVYIEARRLYIR